MKKIMKTGMLGMLTAMLIVSCTVQKRHYMGGYHVEWKHKAKTSGTAEKNEETINESAAGYSVSEQVAADKTIETKQAEPVMQAEEMVAAENTIPAEASVTTKSTDVIVNETETPVVQTTIVEEETVVANHTPAILSTEGPAQPMASTVVLIILCILFPLNILAVGIATDWGNEVIWNILWSLTIIGGVIHGIVVCLR